MNDHTSHAVIGDVLYLDWEELGDTLGVPFEYCISHRRLELELMHVEAIVAGHCSKTNYIREVTGLLLKTLPHALKAKAEGNTITVEFDIPVEIREETP